MSQLWTALMGKKTYIVGFVSIAYALVNSYLVTDPLHAMPVAEATKIIETALLGMTIRHGMATGITSFLMSLSNNPNGGKPNANPSAPAGSGSGTTAR